jgi:hypothetical protein
VLAGGSGVLAGGERWGSPPTRRPSWPGSCTGPGPRSAVCTRRRRADGEQSHLRRPHRPAGAASVWDDPGRVEHVALARWGQVLGGRPGDRPHPGPPGRRPGRRPAHQRSPWPSAGRWWSPPAMHTEMWEPPGHPGQPGTPWPAAGSGSCPRPGPADLRRRRPGRLAELDDLVAGVAAAALGRARPERPAGLPAGLVSLGGTREPLDPVRYLGNRSSGGWGRPSWPRPWPRGRGHRRGRRHHRRPAGRGAGWSGSRPPSELYDAVLAAPTPRTCW